MQTQPPLPKGVRLYFNEACQAWHAVLGRQGVKGSYASLANPEGPYTLTMELGPKKTIPIVVLGT